MISTLGRLKLRLALVARCQHKETFGSDMSLLTQRELCPRGHKWIPQGALAWRCLKEILLETGKTSTKRAGWLGFRKGSPRWSQEERFCSHQGRGSERSLQGAFKHKRQQTKYSKKANNCTSAIQSVPVSRLQLCLP